MRARYSTKAGHLSFTLDVKRANFSLLRMKTRISKLTTEQELREKLRKIAALFEGATTSGERDAAAAALHRQATVAANVG